MKARDRMEHYEQLALAVLQRELGPYVLDVKVREDDDHAGEPSLFFEAGLSEAAPFDLARAFIRGQVALRSALVDEGEARFPYLATKRPPGSSVPEDFFIQFRARSAGAGR